MGGGRLVATFTDPDGNVLGLIQDQDGTADRRPGRRRRRCRLTHDIDIWVASASPDGAPYLVPLSFDWEDGRLLVATPTDSPTGRNLAATGTVRLGLGHTRDVTMIEGEVEVLELEALPRERADRFAVRTGFDPRTLTTPYGWFRGDPLGASRPGARWRSSPTAS